jgi:hypothetical protein
MHLGGMTVRGLSEFAWRNRHASAATLRGTPPEDIHFVAAGLLASRVIVSVRLPNALGISDKGRQRLAAYSCGGSSGFGGLPPHRIPS